MDLLVTGDANPKLDLQLLSRVKMKSQAWEEDPATYYLTVTRYYGQLHFIYMNCDLEEIFEKWDRAVLERALDSGSNLGIDWDTRDRISAAMYAVLNSETAEPEEADPFLEAEPAADEQQVDDF